MQISNFKLFIFFAVGILAGALLLGLSTRSDRANLLKSQQLNVANAQEIAKLQSLLINAKSEISQLTDRAKAGEGKVVLLQANLDEMKKAGGTIRLEGEDFSKAQKIDIGASPVKGSKSAAVTIVQFADLQCPFCARFYPVVNDVLKAFPNKVNFVIKNFPLRSHPNARLAAKLALAANEQGKYFEMVELLLQNKADVNEKRIKEYAKKLRLNTKRLIKDYKDKDAQWEAQILADIKLGQQVDVRGTPTFFINGRKTQARDLPAFKTEIDLIPQ